MSLPALMCCALILSAAAVLMSAPLTVCVCAPPTRVRMETIFFSVNLPAHPPAPSHGTTRRKRARAVRLILALAPLLPDLRRILLRLCRHTHIRVRQNVTPLSFSAQKQAPVPEGLISLLCTCGGATLSLLLVRAGSHLPSAGTEAPERYVQVCVTIRVWYVIGGALSLLPIWMKMKRREKAS